MVRGGDVPQRVLDATRAAEAEQVRRAVGTDAPAAVRLYSDVFLGTLVHDVNLVHGALHRLGTRGAVEALGAVAWADGDAASFTARLPGGALWHSSFLLLRGLMDFRERASLYFADAVHELELPAPYWRDAPRLHRVIGVRDGAHAVALNEHRSDAYVAELRHFHACVVYGTACRTPPEQALRDIELLRDLYRLTVPLTTRSAARRASPSAGPARARARGRVLVEVRAGHRGTDRRSRPGRRPAWGASARGVPVHGRGRAPRPPRRALSSSPPLA